MKKKVVGILMTLALAGSLLAGCGSGGGSDQGGSAKADADTGSVSAGDTGDYNVDDIETVNLISSDFTTDDNAVGISTRFFIDELKERSGGKITVTEYFGGTLASSTGSYEAYTTGQADIGTLATFFNPSELPLTQISMAVPFGASTPQEAGEAMEKLKEKHPEIEEEFEKNNLVCLYSKGTENYNLIMKNKVSGLDDLKGQKIAVGGVYSPSWFDAIGVVTTAADSTAAYQNLKTNVYSGTFVYDSVYAQYSLYEVCDCVLDMNGGARCPQSLVINKTKYDSFNDATKAVIQESAQAAAEDYYKWIAEQTESWRKTLTDNGMEIVTLSDEDKAAWGEAIFSKDSNSIQAWIDSADAAGYDGAAIMSDYLTILTDMGCDLPYDTSAFIK